MKRVTVWHFHMKDGSTVTGEYLGAQDDFVYVSTDDEVHRISTLDLTHYLPAKTVDE